MGPDIHPGQEDFGNFSSKQRELRELRERSPINSRKLSSTTQSYFLPSSHRYIPSLYTYFFFFPSQNKSVDKTTSQKNPQQQQQYQSLAEEINQSNKTKLVACHRAMPGGSGWELQDVERILKIHSLLSWGNLSCCWP